MIICSIIEITRSGHEHDCYAPDHSGCQSSRTFLQALQTTNPFLDNRVNAPSASTADVAEIHQTAFSRLTVLATEALQARRGLGSLLWGEAGIGKSHVLSRLASWAVDKACFVYLHNLQAAPDALPRSLLRSVISILIQGRRGQFFGTPLFTLVHGAVLECVPAGQESCRGGWWSARLMPGLIGWAAPTYQAARSSIARFTRCCFAFSVPSANSICDARMDVWLSWRCDRLAGDALDPEDSALLHLPPAPHRGDPVSLVDQQQIRQVLTALSRLAATQQRPFVLAFDQVDNLDAEQFSALARFLEALIDSFRQSPGDHHRHPVNPAALA